MTRLNARLRSLLPALIYGNGSLQTRRRVAEAARRLAGRDHVVSVFVAIDDPYSYLLCCYLPEFRDYYDVGLRLYVTDAVADDFRPAPERQSVYAIRDCRRLARELGVPFLDIGSAPPVDHGRALADALLVEQSADDFEERLERAIAAYWRGDARGVAQFVASAAQTTAADDVRRRNRRRLRQLGHYGTAMIHYGGEWYWGIDRLHYLIDRLDSLGARTQPGLAPRIASIRRVMQVSLPGEPPATVARIPALELFVSFRSPYSYLLLARIFEIADAFGTALRIRPVLPMVARGMRMPRRKRHYIVADASREARTRGIPFGRVVDPLGAGVERCMAAFEYARSRQREREFVLEAGRAIWSRGVDVATDEGLRAVIARAGLSWPDARASLEEGAWRGLAEKNRAAMMASGGWGVPTIRIGDWLCWGQDRDWLVARHLEDLCDGSEGERI